MAHKRIVLVLVLILLAVVAVPAVHAQSTQDIDFDDIIAALGPREGQELIFDIMLYLIFFIALVNMVLIPDKQLFVSLLNFGVIGLAVFSKLLVGTRSSAVFRPDDFPVFVLNVGMFVIPFLMAGMLRDRRGTPKAMYPSLLLGLLGGGYFFMFWAMEQREGSILGLMIVENFKSTLLA